MTRIYSMAALIFIAGNLAAQPNEAVSRSLGINSHLTTSIIFPQVIASVDRGSGDVLVKKVKDHENILLVKAGKENFAPTDMTVITASGRLYTFMVRYDSTPSVLEIEVSNRPSLVQRIASQKRIVSDHAERKYSMVFRLDGIYIDRNLLYFQLEVDNASHLPYQADRLRFFVRDRKRGKRTAIQEIEEQPLQVAFGKPFVTGMSNDIMVAVLDGFTLADGKILVAELTEKSGARNLRVKIRNRDILRARPLP